MAQLLSIAERGYRMLRFGQEYVRKSQEAYDQASVAADEVAGQACHSHGLQAGSRNRQPLITSPRVPTARGIAPDHRKPLSTLRVDRGEGHFVDYSPSTV